MSSLEQPMNLNNGEEGFSTSISSSSSSYSSNGGLRRSSGMMRRTNSFIPIEIPEQDSEALKRVMMVFLRCFLLGCSGRTILNGLYYAVSKLGAKPGRVNKMKLIDIIDWRFGMFLGSFSAGYKLIILLLAQFQTFKRNTTSLLSSSSDDSSHQHHSRNPLAVSTNTTNTALTYPQVNNAACLIAGAISGSSLLFIDKSERTTFALYGLTRAGEFFFRALDHTNRLPEWMSKFGRYDLVVMCLSALQILYCYVGHREALSPSYRSFLDKFGAKDVRVLNALEEKYRGKKLNLEGIRNFCAAHGLPPSYPFDEKTGILLGCHMLHPKQGCIEHAITFWLQGLRRALWLYAPVHGVYTLLLLVARRRRRAASSSSSSSSPSSSATGEGDSASSSSSSSPPSSSKPEVQLIQLFRRFLVNVGFSTMFLSTYCTIAWGCFCFMTQVMKEHRISRLRPTMLLPGLAVLFESRPRQLELALYCLPRAMEAFYNEFADFGLLPRIKNAELSIFCLATSVFMCCFTQHPDSIKPSFLTVLKWLWT